MRSRADAEHGAWIGTLQRPAWFSCQRPTGLRQPCHWSSIRLGLGGILFLLPPSGALDEPRASDPAGIRRSSVCHRRRRPAVDVARRSGMRPAAQRQTRSQCLSHVGTEGECITIHCSNCAYLGWLCGNWRIQVVNRRFKVRHSSARVGQSTNG